MGDVPTLKLVRTVPEPETRQAGPRPDVARARRIVAVGGGKGGIGKSLISANLGIELARRRRRVVLVDADLGGANLHTTLGLDVPKRTLSDFIERRVPRIDDVVTPTGIENLGLVSGALDHLDAANPPYAQKMRLLRHVQQLDVDYAILDLGAGTHTNVLDFFLVADHGVLVLVPEPTAVENAYRFVKAAFWRRMRNVAQVYGYEPLLRTVMAGGNFRSPVELVTTVSQRDPEAGANLARQLAAFRPRLVVNEARTPQDADVGKAVVAAWRKYFGLEMDYLGFIPYDDEMWRTLRARRPLLVERPDVRAAKAFAGIADALLALDIAARHEA
ncbi:ATP-binding protein [Anaeromyxobacter dehalogenans 2CP-1]|uniref:ATP-binding protein n=1 Tax=Anaeromyxobacter dehalogenans (strain ATCC BAA-258 / DSM 21875 / 2CP-1) TaxID=455488 RepID=B8J8A2_ANAD2|nr:P-loop NTPase [Anaeromyxobacter dehalogenans]ACL65401.1 ATP-binding protein [Anaeromyxobacter dehalogenans 2CP-1]